MNIFVHILKYSAESKNFLEHCIFTLDKIDFFNPSKYIYKKCGLNIYIYLIHTCMICEAATTARGKSACLCKILCMEINNLQQGTLFTKLWHMWATWSNIKFCLFYRIYSFHPNRDTRHNQKLKWKLMSTKHYKATISLTAITEFMQNYLRGVYM